MMRSRKEYLPAAIYSLLILLLLGDSVVNIISLYTWREVNLQCGGEKGGRRGFIDY